MKYALNLRGRLLDLSEPKVMGIINVTPDSFYTKGKYADLDGALFQAEKMLHAGAAILDIGGQSTRPGAPIITEENEKFRVVPVVEAILKQFPDAIVSIDTYWASVAKASLEIGAHIINDISGGEGDRQMFQTVSDFKASYIMMHRKGDQENMQQSPQYEDVVVEVLDYLKERVAIAKTYGIDDMILDLGFGFGKTLEHNYSLMKHIPVFAMMGLPMLVGVSRKSMIYKALDITPDEALNGTTVLHMFALMQGCKILRVHDVKEANEVIKLARLIKNAQ